MESSVSSQKNDNTAISSSEPTQEQNTIQEEKLITKIPLSTSVILTRLPRKKQEVLNQTLKNSESSDQSKKITIRFQPIGSAPMIKPKVFKISPHQSFSVLIKFLTKRLRLKSDGENSSSKVFCYIHNSFAPNPDENLGNLHDNFAINGELLVSYCNTVAFG